MNKQLWINLKIKTKLFIIFIIISAFSFALPAFIFCFCKEKVAVFLGVVFLFLGILYIAALYCSRYFTISLNRIIRTLELGKTGDFAARVQYSGKDEFGGLVEQVNEFMRKLEIYANSISGIIQMHREAEEKIKKSEARLRSFMETSNQGFWEVDTTGIILDVNPAMCKMLGREKINIFGHSVFSFVDSENMRILRDQLEIRKTGQKSSYEIALLRSDGKCVYCLCNSAPLFDEQNNFVGSFSLVSDITKRKEAEDEVQRLNQDLEERVRLRTEELQESVEKFQYAQLQVLKADQQKVIQNEKMQAMGSLVAGVAHEINTPIGVGVTAASHLEHKTKEYIDLYHKGNLKRSELEAYIKVANESSTIIMTNLRRASDLIQSFKQVAVDQSAEKKRYFDIKKYTEDVLISLHPHLRKTKLEVQVSCDSDIEIYSDPGAFSQIITNFVMNSMLHGFKQGEKGLLQFKIWAEGEKLFFEYSDNGSGIKEEFLSRVFEPFFTTKRGQGGSGLGMHIVYNLVAQTLGGTIECKSSPYVKTAFLITIPLGEKESSDVGKE